MVITNVNDGEQSGLKRLLKHVLPLGNWEVCDSHKMALYFKHLLKDFPGVFSADTTLLALWRLFHHRPLAINFLSNSAEVYEECHVIPVCLSVTR